MGWVGDRMEFFPIILELKQKGLAARRFEREGHGRFRDCLTVCQNGKFLFERYCYGEAAGLVFSMWAAKEGPEGAILWDYDSCPYTGKEEAPTRLSEMQEGNLFFDGQNKAWKPVADIKRMQKGPSGILGLFKRNK